MKTNKANLYQMLIQEVAHKKKKLQQFKFILKLKLVLCVILPVVVLVAAAQVLKLYLSLQLKQMPLPGQTSPSQPIPLKKQVLKLETVPQEPAGRPVDE